MFLRRAELHGGELEGDHVGAHRNGDARSQVGRGVQGRSLRAEIHRLVDEFDAGDLDGSGRTVLAQLLRIKVVEAVHAAEPELAGCVFRVGVAVEFIALQAIGYREVAEYAGMPVEAGKTFVGADPQATAVVRQHAVHHIVRQPVRGGEALRGARTGVETVQPTGAGAYPEHARRVVRVGADAEDDVGGEGTRVLRIMREMPPLAGARVQAQQALHGARPDHPIRIFMQRCREPIGVVDRLYRPLERRERVGAYIASPKRLYAAAPEEMPGPHHQREQGPLFGAIGFHGGMDQHHAAPAFAFVLEELPGIE